MGNKAELTRANIVSVLVENVPELGPLYKEHIEDHDEILADVFFGDLTRFVQELHSRDQSARVVDAILEILERGMNSADLELQNLISVSFVENLNQDMRNFETLRAKFGNGLTSELRKYRYG